MYEIIISVSEKAIALFWHCFPYLLSVAGVIMVIVTGVRFFLIMTDKIEIPYKSYDYREHAGEDEFFKILVCLFILAVCVFLAKTRG